MIVTLSTTVITVPKTLKLHTAKTNWQTYRNILDTRIQLNISLKTPEEVDVGIDELTTILQEAARQATHSPRTNNVTFDIKNIILKKRNARKKWHRSHSRLDKTLFNQLSTRLKKKLKEAQNTSFFNYVSSCEMIEKTNKMQQMFIFNSISTCFGHHYAHLQENKTYYCMWCAALVLLDVVGSDCGALPCRVCST